MQAQIKNCHVVADISPLKRASSLEEKYSNDAKILEDALEKEPGNERYMFYLAQSYRDSSQLEKGIEAYQKRIDMGGWEEEVYYSLYMIAKISEKMGKDDATLTNLYSKAWEYRPSRLESVFHVMRKLRDQGRHLISFAYGDVAIKTKGTADILFIEPEIWQWRLLDEYSLAAYYIGNPDIALEKTSAILNAPFFKDIAPEEQARLKKNFDYYKKGSEEKAKKIQQMQAMQLEINNRGQVAQIKEEGANKRKLMEVTAKAHNTETMAEVRVNDQNTRSITSQNKTEIDALVNLLIHNMPIDALAREIERRNAEQMMAAEFAVSDVDQEQNPFMQ
jgi:hypothetical protein